MFYRILVLPIAIVESLFICAVSLIQAVHWTIEYKYSYELYENLKADYARGSFKMISDILLWGKTRKLDELDLNGEGEHNHASSGKTS